MIEEISRWCAAYFDEGQAAWTLPGRSLRPYSAWRQSMRQRPQRRDVRVRGFRASVAAMPYEPARGRRRRGCGLGHSHRGRRGLPVQSPFRHRRVVLLRPVSRLGRRLEGRSDERIVDLLAIRLVWGHALFADRQDEAFRAAWAKAMADAAALPDDNRLGDDPDLALGPRAAGRLRARPSSAARGPACRTAEPRRPRAGRAPRPCRRLLHRRAPPIRVYRRALETVSPQVKPSDSPASSASRSSTCRTDR